MALSSPALAAADYYLEIEGVEGEAASRIDIESWSWRASSSVATDRSANLNLSKSNINGAAQPLPENGSLSIITAAKPSSAQAKATNLNTSRSNVYRQGQTGTAPPPPPVETSNLNFSKSNINRQQQAGQADPACAAGKHFPRGTLPDRACAGSSRISWSPVARRMA